ncbi:hypothetical protein B0H14DRAFT_2624557 [Mycena olivaceomarginata]|nr:hypothetical protein B0H14DRAFT_2624557 [Mycena olivaceomarginata]
MPLLAVALTYGSFGDIKETIALAGRIYEILRSGGKSSSEVQKVLLVLKCFHDDVATLMTHLGTDSSADAQSIVNRISAALMLQQSRSRNYLVVYQFESKVRLGRRGDFPSRKPGQPTRALAHGMGVPHKERNCFGNEVDISQKNE